MRYRVKKFHVLFNGNVDEWQLRLLGRIVKEPIPLRFPVFITIKRYSTNAAEDVWAARIWEKEKLVPVALRHA